MTAMAISGDKPGKFAFWVGWFLSAVPALFLLSGSVTAWMMLPPVIAGTSKLGYAPAFLRILSPIEFVCAVLFLIPRTAVLGALLITAYMGGAVASHARVADPGWPAPIVFAMLMWAGLLLRRPALRGFLF